MANQLGRPLTHFFFLFSFFLAGLSVFLCHHPSQPIKVNTRLILFFFMSNQISRISIMLYTTFFLSFYIFILLNWFLTDGFSLSYTLYMYTHTHTLWLENPTQTKQTINKNKSQLSNRKKAKKPSPMKKRITKYVPGEESAVLRDPTAHPESAAEIKKNECETRNWIGNEYIHIQDYVYA